MSIFRRILGLLLPTFVFFSCGSEDSKSRENSDQGEKVVNEQASEEVVVDENSSLLWKITGKRLEEPSYLYGTIHMIPAEHYNPGDMLMEKIRECDRLVMEVEDITNIGAALGAAEGLMLDSGHVEDYVSPETYDKFLSLLESTAGIDRQTYESTYSRMNPFVIYSIIGETDMGVDIVSYEKKFMEEAYDHDLTLGGLETLEDQVSFFKQVPVEELVEYLIHTMESTEESDDSDFDVLVRYYTSQNLDSIFAYMTQTGDVLMKHQDIFLDNRNMSWIPVIEDFIHDEQCFIAVGAAHLPGPNGVINLLRERGYTLTPIATD